MSKKNKLMEEAEKIDYTQIYLNEDRFEEPKEIFKKFHSLILDDNPNVKSFLDVGCATGEFLYYIKKQLPHLSVAGTDILPEFLEVAKKHIPSGSYYVADLESPSFEHEIQYDWVLCSGVTVCMTDIQQALENLLRLVKKGGHLYLFVLANPDPIDVQLSYKRVGVSEKWEYGRNMYSMKTFEDFFNGKVESLEWEDFFMPFPIERNPSDPLRSWTEAFRGEEHFCFTGIGQITYQKILKIKV